MEGDGLRRIRSLDGLRGVAACAVLLSHFSYIAAVPHMPIVAAAIPSRLPVLVFFVLSGFVLTLPFLGSRAPGTLSFLVRRVCRIYAPYAVVMGLAALLFSVLPARRDALEPITVTTLWQSALMWGTVHSISLDVPAWSLIVEMRYSLLFPALVRVTARFPYATLAASVIVSIAAFIAIDVTHPSAFGFAPPVIARSFLASFVVTAYFGLPFVAGIILARDRARLAPLLRAHAPFLWAVALLLATTGAICDPLMILAAALVVALVPNTPAVVRVFERQPIQWLGRVSYSLYLIHYVVLDALLCFGTAVAIWLFVPLSLLAAEGLYRGVERPSTQVGRALSN